MRHFTRPWFSPTSGLFLSLFVHVDATFNWIHACFSIFWFWSILFFHQSCFLRLMCVFFCLCWDLNFFLHSEFKLRSVDWITPACIVPTQETQQPSLWGLLLLFHLHAYFKELPVSLILSTFYAVCLLGYCTSIDLFMCIMVTHSRHLELSSVYLWETISTLCCTALNTCVSLYNV